MAKVKVELIGDASSLQRAFGSAGRASSKFGSTMAKAGKIAAVGVAGGMVAAAYATKKFAQAAMDAEASQAKVETMLRNNGISWAKHGKQIDAVIQKHAALTGFDDEELAESFANMVRTTGDVNKAFKLNALAADIARSKGMGLAGAQSLLARVYNGSFTGVKRLGIDIEKVTAAQDALKESTSKATVEQIRAAKAADETATRQKAIALLQEQFGGQAEAYGKTAAGAMERFKVASENLQEQLGSVLLPVITRVAGGAADFITKFSEAKTAGDKFRLVTDTIKTAAEQAFKAVSDAVRKINWPEVIRQMQAGMTKAAQAGFDALRQGLARVNWNELGKMMGQSVTRALQAVAAAFKAVNWEQVGKQVVTRIGQFFAGVNWGQVLKATFNALVAVLKANAQIVKGAASAIGLALVQGIGAGIDALWDWLKAKVAWLSGMIPDWMRKFLDIGSPSKVMADLVGKPIVQGVVSGMESEKLNLAAASAKIADSAKRAFVEKVNDAREDIKSAFASWGDAAIAAYDDNWDRLQKRIQDKRTKASLGKDVASAKDALKEARLGLVVSGVMNEGESLDDWSARNKEARDRVLEAQATLDSALQAQRDFANEQKHAKDRQEFQAGLERLQADGVKLVNQNGANQQAIIARLNTFLKKYHVTGVNLGTELARGLEKSLSKVQDAVDAIVREIDRMNTATGRATSGVLRTVRDPKNTPGARAMGGPVTAGMPYVVGERGPELFVPNVSGHIVPNNQTTGTARQASTVVNVSFPNYVGSRDDLIRTVREGLADVARRNPGALPGIA